MDVIDRDLAIFLLCDVCEGEITFPDRGDTGCCAACGIAYAFDPRDLRASA